MRALHWHHHHHWKVLTGEMLARCTREMEQRGDDGMRYDIALQPSPPYLDASTQGNVMRFINHSCNPNCSFDKWTDADGFSIIKVFSTRFIEQFEELTTNHGWTDGRMCTCGEQNCVRTSGGAPKPVYKKSRLAACQFDDSQRSSQTQKE